MGTRNQAGKRVERVDLSTGSGVALEELSSEIDHGSEIDVVDAGTIAHTPINSKNGDERLTALSV